MAKIKMELSIEEPSACNHIAYAFQKMMGCGREPTTDSVGDMLLN